MPSFDIESTFDNQEVSNATIQAQKEISTRYDFKQTHTSIEFRNPEIQIISSTIDRLQAANQVLVEKLIKRNVSGKILTNYVDSKDSKSNIKRTYTLISGIPQEEAKKLVKNIKQFDKKIQTSIQGPTIRVSSKKRDELQLVIALVKDMNLNYPVNFSNFKD